MARTPRTYRTPIVITLAAAACFPGCGSGSSDDDGSGGASTGGKASGGQGTGGRATGGQVGTGGQATGGQGAGGSTGGQASGGMGGEQTGGTAGGPSLPECPSDYSFPQMECTPEARCQMTMGCTAGESRVFYFECDSTGERWDFEGGDCENPYEFCERSGHTLCVEDAWYYQGQGGNPPAPCPEELPDEGADCNFGSGFGADRDACGYPCGDAWTVTGCVGLGEEQGGPGNWVSDGACSAGGAGPD